MTALDDPDVAAIARISSVPTILRVISETTGLRLTLVARVTHDTWKACAVHDQMSFGLEPGGLLEVATTLCSEVRDTRMPIVIDHASEDPLFRDHRTPKQYGLESYISVPIFLRDGSYFGNVCALDANPAKLKNSAALAMMQLYAELIGVQLEAEQRQAQTQAALLTERQTAELREQFIAVLGHDLRTPLGSVATGAELLLRRELGPSERKIVERIRGSAGRMSRLVDDLLDFARGRLGGGIALSAVELDDLERVFRQVVEEARANHPDRTIEYYAEPLGRFRGDPNRLGQLLSNLLGNALQHGRLGAPVGVVVRRSPSELSLTVKNLGEPIPEPVVSRLFQPFFRGDSDARTAGLGLGLYIVSEIVKSHGGHIDVTSSQAAGTTFRCTFPLRN